MADTRGSLISPFISRPWMTKNGAAAAAGGSTGLKGIVAGKLVGWLSSLYY